jgi:P27 family predicted phage terminase small subunit
MYDSIVPITDARPAPQRRRTLVQTDALAHLSDAMRAWHQETVNRYVLDSHHVHILRLACEAFDRAQTSREQVLRDGPTFTDKNGNLRSHPAIAVERDARAAFAKLVKQLDLDPPKPDGRLGPRAGGGIGITHAQLAADERD